MLRITCWCVLILLLACIFTCSWTHATCPQSQSGLTLFSSLSNWNVKGADITISNAVKVDQASSVVLRSIIVSDGGSLIFDDANLNLNVEFIRVDKGGKFIMGSSDCPINNKITVTFYGNRTTENVIGSDPYDSTACGYKGIALMSGSYLQLYGAVNRPSWTNIAATVKNGALQFTTMSETQWKVGDKILMTTTDFGELTPWYAGNPWTMTGTPFPDQNEERTIVQVINSHTFIVDYPFNYTHWGEGYIRAEVGVLNRNIVFRGDDSSGSTTQAGFGGHFMIRLLSQCEISGIEVTKMGQKGLMGRYSIHFHLLANHAQSIGKQFFIKDSSIHHAFQRCVTVHASNGILVQDNICFDSYGHQYFLEDGSEESNFYIRNLGVKPRPVPDGNTQQIIRSDHDVSVFWITNPNNTWIGNAAVGGVFGYWFTMPEYPTGLSSSIYGTTIKPRTLPLGRFINNVVHASRIGLMIDNMENADGTSSLASYNPPSEAWFYGVVAYKNRDHGVWARGSSLGFSGLVAMDNVIGVGAPPGPIVVRDSLIVGESENVGLAYRPAIDVGGRSRPGYNDYNNIIKGFDTYDNGGPQYLINVTFKGFVANSYNSRIGALGQATNGPFKYLTQNKYSGVKFDANSNRAYIHNEDWDNNHAAAWYDCDGGITGRSPGGWVVANDSLLYHKGCSYVPLWQGYNCPVGVEGYAQFAIVAPSSEFTSQTNVDAYSDLDSNVVRMYVHDLSRGGKSGVHGQVGAGGSTNFYLESNLMVRNFYAVRWVYDSPSPSYLQFSLSSCASNEWIIVTIQYPRGTVFDIKRNSWISPTLQSLKQATSLLQLTTDPSYYYYDSTTENLYLHLINRNGNGAFTEAFDMVNYYHDGASINVNAKCPNSDCSVSDTSLPKVSTGFINTYKREDRFAGILQPCQISSSMSNVDGYGVVFAVLLTGRRKLDITIHHTLTTIATKVEIGIGDPGKVERFIVQTGANYPEKSMSRFSVDLSYYEIVSLLKGRVFIKLSTTQYPNGHLRAQLLCNHGVDANGQPNCQVPIAVSAVEPCDPVSDSLPFYTDYENATAMNFYVKSWGSGTTVNSNYVADPICGKSSIRVSMYTDRIQIYRTVKNMVDLSVYKYFEFFIRALNTNETTLTAFFSESNSALPNGARDTGLFVDPKYIQYFKIDETSTTRVRIPIADIGFYNSNAITEISAFGLYLNDYSQGRREFIIDNIRFVTGNDVEQTDSSFDSSQIVGFSSKLGICNPDSVSNPDSDPLGVKTITTSVITADASTTISPTTSKNKTTSAAPHQCVSLLVLLLAIIVNLF